jgi:phosphoribosylamine--glycine ligase
MDKINIAILGSGGREHTFAWKLAQSPLIGTLFCLPGNGGTAPIATNVSIDILDFEAIAKFCLEQNVCMLVIGPEAPLVAGVADYFETRAELMQIHVIGPKRVGAQLEGSKDFSKQFMLRHNIPTARAMTFDATTAGSLLPWLQTLNPPYVVKADGLAAGKGVVICGSLDEALAEAHAMLFDGKFAQAGSKVVIEEFLDGIEVSVFALTDGNNFLLLPEAKDYKRIGEGDNGPNTGGMGAVSPVPFFTDVFKSKVIEKVVKPTFQGLKSEGIDYKGFVFFGLMNVGGEPYVIEYNARMGDPETEAVLPRIKNDLVPLFMSLKHKSLDKHSLDLIEQTAVTIVSVAEGYPGDYKKGDDIVIMAESEGFVFHAGTKKTKDGGLQTAGGRVMAFTGLGNSIAEAKLVAINASKTVTWQGKYQRNDIGDDLKKSLRIEK